MKVISFVVNAVSKSKMQLVEYPQLNALMEEGYELVDTLPAWGAGNRYVITFLLNPPEPKRKKK